MSYWKSREDDSIFETYDDAFEDMIANATLDEYLEYLADEFDNDAHELLGFIFDHKRGRNFNVWELFEDQWYDIEQRMFEEKYEEFEEEEEDD